MSIRIISNATVSDYDGYLAFARKWEDLVRNSPGAVRVEAYGDRKTNTVFYDEEWADGDALLHHVGQMQESGLLDELMQRQTMEALVLLTPTDHAGVLTLLDQFGARRMERIALVEKYGSSADAGARRTHEIDPVRSN